MPSESPGFEKRQRFHGLVLGILQEPFLYRNVCFRRYQQCADQRVGRKVAEADACVGPARLASPLLPKAPMGVETEG